MKGAESLPAKLITQPLNDHVQVDAAGRVDAKTKAGEWLRDQLLLDAPVRVTWRSMILRLYAEAQDDFAMGQRTSRTRLFGYPIDLPDLMGSLHRNGRGTMSVGTSSFVRRARGELEEFY